RSAHDERSRTPERGANRRASQFHLEPLFVLGQRRCAAAALGWHGIHHTSAAATRARLRELGALG
ncbi:hypothetical protein ACPYIY_34390, partial [Burkholderia pseudomallei]